MEKIVTKQALKYAEKQGRWLRKHEGHDVRRVKIDGAIILVCADCDRANVSPSSARFIGAGAPKAPIPGPEFTMVKRDA